MIKIAIVEDEAMYAKQLQDFYLRVNEDHTQKFW